MEVEVHRAVLRARVVEKARRAGWMQIEPEGHIEHPVTGTRVVSRHSHPHTAPDKAPPQLMRSRRSCRAVECCPMSEAGLGGAQRTCKAKSLP